MHIPVRLLLAITDFGDSAVISFATLSACLILVATGAGRSAARFLANMFVAASAIALAKIYFIGCGNAYSRALLLYSPSGHAALTTAFCGSLASFAAAHRSRLQQSAVWIAAAAAIAAISLSRVLLGFHSLTEIVTGCALGAAALFTVRHRMPFHTNDAVTIASRRQYISLIAGVVLVGLCVHGRHFPAERIIRYLAMHVHRYIPACARA